MKAIILNGFGGPENLVPREVATPACGPGQVSIRVKAVSINPIDIKTRSGKGLAEKLKHEDPIILGWDVSGVVAESSASSFHAGQEVFGMVSFPGHGKAYAETVVADAEDLALKPAAVPHEECAAACLAALTAWQALHVVPVHAGDRVLIHAGAGGVGHYAIQIAKGMGATVITTASETNHSFVRDLGADQAIDYHQVRFEEAAGEVDLVLDTIGGAYIDRSLSCIRPGGAIISLPSATNSGVVEKAEAAGIQGYRFLVSSRGKDMGDIASWLANGRLRSYCTANLPMEEMANAHRMLEHGHVRGKIVLHP